MRVFDGSYFLKTLPKILLQGVPVTILVTAAALALGFLLGLLLTIVKVYPVKPTKGGAVLRLVQRVLDFVTLFVRGVPNFLMLYLIYFGLPEVLEGIGLSLSRTSDATKYYLVIAALGLTVAAPASEMFRSAYLSVDVQQIEAGKSFGYSGWQRFLHIILPQAFYVSIPNIGNRTIQVIHGTSLISYLGVLDIMGVAKLVNSYVYGAKSVEVYVTAALVYWVMTILLERAFRLLEKKSIKGMQNVAEGTV